MTGAGLMHGTRKVDQAVELRTTALYSVSHDLRAPLSAIRAVAGTLRAVDVDAQLRDAMLADIEREVDRLTRLVSSLLEASRVEAGALVTRRVRVPVDELCRGAVSDARAVIGERPVELTVASHLAPAEVDETMLRQVLVNLLENASIHDAGTIGLRARQVRERLELRVVDHGPGVPEPDRGRIFEPFERLRPNAPGRARGTGLGLSIARGFVRAHAGKIDVEETHGGGATFVVSLPLAWQGATEVRLPSRRDRSDVAADQSVRDVSCARRRA